MHHCGVLPRKVLKTHCRYLSPYINIFSSCLNTMMTLLYTLNVVFLRTPCIIYTRVNRSDTVPVKISNTSRCLWLETRSERLSRRNGTTWNRNYRYAWGNLNKRPVSAFTLIHCCTKVRNRLSCQSCRYRIQLSNVLTLQRLLYIYLIKSALIWYNAHFSRPVNCYVYNRTLSFLYS